MTSNPLCKVLLSACVAVLCLNASARPLVEETFDYPNGSLNGKSGGSGFTGNWTVYTQNPGTLNVTDHKATIHGSATGWATATRTFKPIDLSDGGEFYFSYDVNVSSLSLPATSSTLYTLSFRAGADSIFNSGIYFNPDGYRLRSEIVGSGRPVGNISAQQTTANVPMFVVGKVSYDKATSKATVSYWLNTTDSTATIAYTASWDVADFAAFTSIRIERYDSYNVAASTVGFGDLRIGTDWDSVIPIPEPAHTVLLGGVAALAVGLLVRRRTCVK